MILSCQLGNSQKLPDYVQNCDQISPILQHLDILGVRLGGWNVQTTISTFSVKIVPNISVL